MDCTFCVGNPSHVSTEGHSVLKDTDCVYYSFHVHRGYERVLSVCVCVCDSLSGFLKDTAHLLVFLVVMFSLCHCVI